MVTLPGCIGPRVSEECLGQLKGQLARRDDEKQLSMFLLFLGRFGSGCCRLITEPLLGRSAAVSSDFPRAR